MNTADRSIALVDLALRRRFYFVEFHPDDEPVRSVLREWLAEKGACNGVGGRCGRGREREIEGRSPRRHRTELLHEGRASTRRPSIAFGGTASFLT